MRCSGNDDATEEVQEERKEGGLNTRVPSSAARGGSSASFPGCDMSSVLVYSSVDEAV